MAQCFDVTVVLLVFGRFFLFLFFWFVCLVYLPVEPVQTKKSLILCCFCSFKYSDISVSKQKQLFCHPIPIARKCTLFFFLCSLDDI